MQPEYITQYYSCIEFSNVQQQLYDCLQKEEFRKEKLYIATDGGAVKYKGSLGIIFSNSIGDTFLTCYGQPAGYDPRSFRSEICAALAALRLLRLYIMYYDDRLGNNTISKEITIHIYLPTVKV